MNTGVRKQRSLPGRSITVLTTLRAIGIPVRTVTFQQASRNYQMKALHRPGDLQASPKCCRVCQLAKHGRAKHIGIPSWARRPLPRRDLQQTKPCASGSSHIPVGKLRRKDGSEVTPTEFFQRMYDLYQIPIHLFSNPPGASRGSSVPPVPCSPKKLFRLI